MHIPKSVSIWRRLWRALGFPLVLLAALLIWFEEWLWEPLGALMHRIGQCLLLRQIESLIARAPPWLALMLFAIPVAALFPFKLAGLWLIAHHHGLLGACVFLGAKIVGTALGAHLLALTKPALMQIDWFRRLWDSFARLRAYVFLRIRANRQWRWLRFRMYLLRTYRKSFLQRMQHRWNALLRLLRKKP